MVPAQISNPGYYVVTEPAKITPIGAVAIEVWVTNQDIVFDNMLIAADPDVAKAVAAETWALRHQAEQARQAESLSNMQGAGDRVWKPYCIPCRFPGRSFHRLSSLRNLTVLT